MAQAQQVVETLRASGARRGGGPSPRSLQLSVVVLKAATAWSFETGLVGRDPLAGHRRPRGTGSGRAGAAWTADEARTFLMSVADDRLAAAWELLLTRGLRRGELAGLRWDAVDLKGATIRVVATRVMVDGRAMLSAPKTDAGRRSIPLDPVLVASLRRHGVRQSSERLVAGPAWSSTGYVFTDEIGEPMRPEYFSKRFKALVQASGLRQVRLHDTRHTAASLMLASGENVKVVAELLGHSTPTITQTTYQHVMPGMSEQAGERLSVSLLG